MLSPFVSGFPLLFVDASGVALVNQVIYAVVIVVFAVGSFLVMRLYLQSKSGALYWFLWLCFFEVWGLLELLFSLFSVMLWLGLIVVGGTLGAFIT
jgi:hypothetical protein